MHLHIRLGHFGSEPAMSKVNKEQKEMLLEFIEANKDLAKGKFSTPQGAKDAVRLWEEAAVKLNACGVRKSWKEWRKCWHDLKTATKGKVAALALEGKRTGGGPPAEEELQDFHKRVYALIGSNAVLGHQNTCESRVMVLGEEIGDLIYLPQHNPSSASTSTIHMYTTPITPTSPSTTISAAPNISIPCPSETDPDSIVPEPTPNLPTPTALRTITLPTVESIGAKDTPQRKMRQENSTTQPVKKMAAEQLIEVEREKMVLEKRRMLAEERGIALEEEKVAIKRRKMELEEERVTRSDGYPQTVCSSCLDKLTDFKMFKEQCKGSMAAFENGFHPDKFNFVDGPETICGRAFNRKDKLSLHRKTHNAEKPYQCPTCLKCFCRSDYLLMHCKTVHLEEEVSKFPCLACGTVFGKGKDLLAHIRTAHFSCADCDAAFLTEGELAAHAEAEKHNSGQQLDCVDCEPSQYLESQPPASQPAPQALSLEQDFRQLLPATAPGMLPTPADQEVLELLTLLANNKDSPKLTR
ncbi:zinc finger protein 205-like isoform X2 [Ischnura elegans]|uniref:zinc finger protein 205-like isoform X2 n=1 Tax=Ischnura elegans TaxID=197161 RepID=UPI001ED890F1|nr:zinc finger protein 205-like isoform X2 [Ischnura elegans]